MKIYILGYTGVVGHVVASYFKEAGYEVLCGEEKVAYDICRLKYVIETYQPDAIINCAALVNEAAEEDKSSAAYINSYLPHLLEKLTVGTSTIVVHRSTDCIFSGMRGEYMIEDWPDAKSFYARTKAVGEIVNNKDITIRVSLIGPATDPDNASLFNWFLRQSGEVKGFANSIWTGLTTIEYAKTIESLLLQKAYGLFQAAPNEKISKYDLLKLFEKHFPNSRDIVSVNNDRVDKSLVPYWGSYEINIPSYEEQIVQMKKWIDDHKDIYPSFYFENQ